jgi:hypothetical protein
MLRITRVLCSHLLDLAVMPVTNKGQQRGEVFSFFFFLLDPRSESPSNWRVPGDPSHDGLGILNAVF